MFGGRVYLRQRITSTLASRDHARMARQFLASSAKTRPAPSPGALKCVQLSSARNGSMRSDRSCLRNALCNETQSRLLDIRRERVAARAARVHYDDAAVLKSLARLLRAEQWAVETFDSSEAFLAQWQSAAPGCVVLDVDLPGLDGLELQRRLVESGSQVPIIFLTGQGDIPMTVRAIQAGAVDFSPSR